MTRGGDVTVAWAPYKCHDGVRFPAAPQTGSSVGQNVGLISRRPRVRTPPRLRRSGRVARTERWASWFMPAVPKTATRKRREFEPPPFRREDARVVEVAEPLTRQAKASRVRIPLFPLCVRYLTRRRDRRRMGSR